MLNDTLSHFRNISPKPLRNFGFFKKEHEISNKVSIDRVCWANSFQDGELPDNKTKVEDRIYAAGLYCFWWIGDLKDVLSVNEVHYVKGKQFKKGDGERIGKAPIQIVNSGKKHRTSGQPIKHLYHKAKWEYHPLKIMGQQFTPFYVGKSGHIFDRINGHLGWVGSRQCFYRVPCFPDVKSESGQLLPTVLSAKKDTQTQFRRAFEFLFKDIKVSEGESVDQKRRDILLNRIGLSIYKNSLSDFEDRFYGEDLLIGTFRPPFNLDSER